jgi:hypothetical protein
MRLKQKGLGFMIGAAIAGLFLGIAAAHSTDTWIKAFERGQTEAFSAKKELLASAGLEQLHHTIFAQVGETKWEREVKPAFLSAITQATARETGELFPDWRTIVGWVRAHPEEARRMLRDAAGVREPRQR